MASPKPAKPSSSRLVTINRAPVLTLWAAVVAERMGFDRDESLTLGKVMAGLNARRKGVGLGLYTPASTEKTKASAAEKKSAGTVFVELLGFAVPATKTAEGLRGSSRGRVEKPESVRRYLESKFGDSLADARRAMERLAASLDPDALSLRAYELYETFRPEIPRGTRGWGAKGVLDLDLVRGLASGRKR